MAGIGIITNPHSKLNKRNPRRQELLGYVAGEQGRLEITNSLDELDRVAQEFYNRDIEILAINGGDGTISRTITAFIKAYQQEGRTKKSLPPIVILRGGTINMLAANLGIKGSPEKVLFRLMEAHSTGTYKDKKSLYSINVEGSYGFLFGNGLSYTFLEEFYKNKTGALGAAGLVLKIIFSKLFGKGLYHRLIQEEQTSLFIDDKPEFSHKTCTVLCSTVEKMPLGPKLFWKNSNNTGFFQIISAITSAKSAWFSIPSSVLLRPRKEDKTKISMTAKTLRIHSQRNANYTLDGELYYPENLDVTLTLGPKLEFLIV